MKIDPQSIQSSSDPSNFDQSELMLGLEKLAKRDFQTVDDIRTIMTKHDELKRIHRQIRSDSYYALLVNTTDIEARSRYEQFLQFDLQFNLLSSRIDRAMLSKLQTLAVEPGDLKSIISKLTKELSFTTPEYFKNSLREKELASQYHTLKKRGASSSADIKGLYCSLVEYRRKQADICGFSSYRSLCEKIDGRDTLTDMLSIIPSDFYSRLNAFLTLPRINAPSTNVEPLSKLRQLLIKHPTILAVFDEMISRQAFDLEPRATKAGIRGIMVFHHHHKKALILANNIKGIALYDIVAHEMAHAYHWTLAAEQPYFELVDPPPDLAEIIAVFFEFFAASAIADDGQTLKWRIYIRLDSVFWSLRLFEFEAAIYSDSEPAVEETWDNINKKYLLDSTSPLCKLEDYWMLFTHPFYYSRYSVATIVGWILFCRYQNSPETLDILTDLMKLGGSITLQQALDRLDIKLNSHTTSEVLSALMRH